MAQATLAGVPFRVNPSSASWDYTVKTAEAVTIGGTVIQVLGVDLGDMTIQGDFGSEHRDLGGNLVGGWPEQDRFLARMKKIAQAQASHPEVGGVRFMFPEKGWDYMVYLRGYTEIGATDAVMAANENFNPTWQLRLFIIEDNSPIKAVQNTALLQYMTRISAGLGWQQSKYNGPISDSDVATFVQTYGQGTTTVKDLLGTLGGGTTSGNP
jgi:hypothetical protein